MGTATASQIARFDHVEKLILKRLDVFANSTTGLAGRNSKVCANRWQPGIRRNQWMLDNIFEHNPMMTRILSREPIDAIQPWFKIDGLSENEQDNVDDFMDRRGIPDLLMEAGTWERLHGGAALFMQLDDGLDPGMAVSPNMIREFGELTVLDRWELFVSEYNTDLRRGRFMDPVMYQLADGGTNIHPSRLLIMPGIKLRRQRMIENQGWGGSVANAVWQRVEGWDTTLDYILEAITRATQGIIFFEGLRENLIKSKGLDIEARIQALNMHMGSLGDIALDKNEDYKVIQRSMAGYREVYEVAQSGLVAVTDMPKTILMGETPGGLNSGGNEGDWRSWTSYLSGRQKLKYSRNVLRMLRYMFAAGNSPLAQAPERITITWGSLFQLSDSDRADITAKYAAAASQLVMASIILADEPRENEFISDAFKIQSIEVEEEESVEDPGNEEEVDPEEEADLIEGEEELEDSPNVLPFRGAVAPAS